MAVSVQWWMNARSVTKFGWLVNIRSMHELNDREKWVGFLLFATLQFYALPGWGFHQNTSCYVLHWNHLKKIVKKVFSL